MITNNSNNFIHSTMYVIGSQVYEDEEIMDCDEFNSQSIYESTPDDYIYEDEMDLLSIAYQDMMSVSNVVVA